MDGKFIRAAEAVLADLEGRAGVGDEIGQVDEETRGEIVDTLAAIIERCVS